IRRRRLNPGGAACRHRPTLPGNAPAGTLGRMPTPAPTGTVPTGTAMHVAPLHRGVLSVLDFRCQAGPHTPVQVERHDLTSVSYVRRGSFGYRARGEEF